MQGIDGYAPGRCVARASVRDPDPRFVRLERLEALLRELEDRAGDEEAGAGIGGAALDPFPTQLAHRRRRHGRGTAVPDARQSRGEGGAGCPPGG